MTDNSEKKKGEIIIDGDLFMTTFWLIIIIMLVCGIQRNITSDIIISLNLVSLIIIIPKFLKSFKEYINRKQP